MCSILLNMRILYEDEAILVIDKPAGLLSIPDGYVSNLPHIKSVLEPDYGPLWVVHRLDKDTSGVMLLARNAHVHQILNDQFSNRETKKEYRALVFGSFSVSLTISAPLKVNGDRHHRTTIDENNGKPASTHFKQLEQICENVSLIQAMPHTGYTHQIRAHLLSAGYPILDDPLYGSPESRSFSQGLPIQRTALHAYQLTFHHPLTNEEISFSSEIPPDMQETITFLKKN
jgi:RluA family pseudouridine synthase